VVTRILVVDDDRAVRESLQRALDLHGFDTDVAADGMEALALMGRTPPDAVVLDVSMPGVDGFGVTRRLRQDGCDVPILLLTARDEVESRATGLDAGADDYLAKPFALEELLARLRALVRRSRQHVAAGQPLLRYADLTVDPAAYEVHRGDRHIELTRTEFDLLVAFAELPERVLSRDILHERVWGYDMSASNTLEVYVGYLRRKLEAGGEPRLIQTVRGFGYVLKQGARA
jgi:two-component system response regulator MprA